MNYIEPSMEIVELSMIEVITASGDEMDEGGNHEEGTGEGVDF